MVNYISGRYVPPPKSPPMAEPVVLGTAPAQSLPAVAGGSKLDTIAAEIKASGKPPSAFFTVKAVDGSRLCHIGGQGVRVSEAEYFQILRAVQPANASDPEQLTIWKLQRRAGQDE